MRQPPERCPECGREPREKQRLGEGRRLLPRRAARRPATGPRRDAERPVGPCVSNSARRGPLRNRRGRTGVRCRAVRAGAGRTRVV